MKYEKISDEPGKKFTWNQEMPLSELKKPENVAAIKQRFADLAAQKATLDKTQSEYERGSRLVGSGAVSEQELEDYKEAYLVAQAQVEVALQNVYQLRVALGLPAKPTDGADLDQVPADLDQNFSSVKQAQASLMQAISVLGLTGSFNLTPDEMIANFLKRDPSGDIDRIYAQLLLDAPGVKQAEAKLAVAQSELAQARAERRLGEIPEGKR